MSAHLTGVQRYTGELLSLWNGKTDLIQPKARLRGLAGHAWEQLVLPRRLGDTLLFSPSNSGPLGVRKQVVTIHDMVYFDHPETLNSRIVAWYRFLLPRLLQRVDRIIAISNFTKERIVHYVDIPAEKVSVVPNGVASRFCPEAISRLEEVRTILQLPSSHYVLAVGSIEPRKNLARLVAAWDRIQNSLPREVWLVIAGAKGYSHIFRDAQIAELPSRVFCAGHVQDELLPALCAGAMAMAYPSFYEGFGLPPLEAMACGTPVLIGDCPAMREVVGEAGILANPLSVESLSDGLLQILQDEGLRSDLRVKGPVRAKQFSWDKTADATWHILEQAA